VRLIQKTVSFGLACLLCSMVRAENYSIEPFPADSILGPDGLVMIPSAVQQFIQTLGTGEVSAVNASGQMAITAAVAGAPDSQAVFAYLPTAAYGLHAGFSQASSDPISESNSTAFAINNSGQIAGTDGDRWTVWNFAGIESPTGTGINPGLAGIATGINDSGQVIMQDFEFETDRARVYVYSPLAKNGYAVGMTDLTPAGTPYPPYPPLSYNAVGINQPGDALYNAGPSNGSIESSTPLQAYLHVGLAHDDLPAGTVTLQGAGYAMYLATGLNDSDEVVGMVNFQVGHAIIVGPALWTPAAGAVDLNSLLPPDSGWTLQTVTGIDELGDIEGTGLYKGVSTPFLLSVPEPIGCTFITGICFFYRRRGSEHSASSKFQSLEAV
jgi:large repetitive protein